MSLGYDNSCTTLSQEGRIYQLEYAEKAIENSSTVMAIVCKDGVILASEKIRANKTITSGSNSSIYSVAPHIGLAICGHLPDGRNIKARAKGEAQTYLKHYGVEITGKILADRIAQYVQAHTLYWGYRPFGACVMISSWDKDNTPHLYMIEANGNYFEYYSCAHGKGRQFVKTEVEKDDFALKKKSTVDALYDAVKILIRSFEGEKETEYDLSVISTETRGFHEVIKKDKVKEIVDKAKAEIENDRKMQVD